VKWHREALGQYNDAICSEQLKTLSLASTILPDTAYAQLLMNDLLERCGELMCHLQKLQAELKTRVQHQDADGKTRSSVPIAEDRDQQGTQQSALTIQFSPTGNSHGSFTSFTPTGDTAQVRSKITVCWTAQGDRRALKFVKLCLHTPRFLTMILDLARHYS
jgi:hypothetical protein